MSIFDGESIYDESPAMRELRAKLQADANDEAELTEDEMDEDDVDYQQQRIDELLRQRDQLRAELNNCELVNEGLHAEVDELRGQLEDEKSENGWAREFLNRIGPKCGKPDCKSLVDYVGQLESERDELQEKARRVDEADSRWEYMRRDLERMTAERDQLRAERDELCDKLFELHMKLVMAEAKRTDDGWMKLPDQWTPEEASVVLGHWPLWDDGSPCMFGDEFTCYPRYDHIERYEVFDRLVIFADDHVWDRGKDSEKPHDGGYYEWNYMRPSEDDYRPIKRKRERTVEDILRELVDDALDGTGRDPLLKDWNALVGRYADELRELMGGAE